MSLHNWIKRIFVKDCDEFLKLLELILDDEANEQDKVFFHRHLENCKSCNEHYNLELAIRRVIKEKIGTHPVPSDLVTSIKTQVRNNL